MRAHVKRRPTEAPVGGTEGRATDLSVFSAHCVQPRSFSPDRSRRQERGWGSVPDSIKASQMTPGKPLTFPGLFLREDGIPSILIYQMKALT